jgi:hypothetical protein
MAPSATRRRAVSQARAYGEAITTVGRCSGGWPANQRPSAVACRSPRGLSGTSWSGHGTSTVSLLAASAAKRATFEALSP